MFDLAVDTTSHALVREFYESGKIVSAVCHGPAALVNIKLSDGTYMVKDQAVTGFSNAEEDAYKFTDAMPFLLEDELRNHGGKYEKADQLFGVKVVVSGKSGNLVTGQNPPSAGVIGFSHSYTSLVTLYTQAPATGHLACSVDAVSLAFTAVQFESQEIMSFAKKRYVAAIQNLGQALRDPKALESNEVLQSVLVLDVYEKLSNREAHTRPSWMSHVQGAMSLVAARGSLNFSNPIACQLTRSVVTTLIISCGAAMVPVPESIISLRKELDVSGVDKKWDFMAILLHIVNLRADVYHDGGGDRTRVVEKAKEIDRNLASLEKTLPEFWKPVVVLAADNHGLQLLDGQYDVYPSHFATQLWNTLRAMRLEMAKIIKDYHQSSEPDASETINRISRRICHTVPQFILPGARPDNAEPFSSIQKLQCRTLLAPLYLAACVSTDTHIQEWICNSIDYMAEKGNIRVAKDIADMLRTRSDIDYWTVWAMTGCYAMTA
ncbi:ThiJ/PfpI family protein [Ilyonectria robusta]